MAGKGPAPKDPAERRRRNKPAAGEWTPAPGMGWQHGKVPTAPTGLMPASKAAWKAWMTSWFAAFWTPGDLPGLRHAILMYDRVERGQPQFAGELRLQMKAYGINPEGQQLLRRTPPKEDAPPTRSTVDLPKEYGDIRAV